MLSRAAARIELPYVAVGGFAAAALVAALLAVLVVSHSHGGPQASAATTPRSDANHATHAAGGGSLAASARGVTAPPLLVHAAHAAATARHGAVVAEAPDPEASLSAPAPPSFHHAAAKPPATAAALIAPGAPSDAQVRAELAEMKAAEGEVQSAQPGALASGASIGGAGGTVTPPSGVPLVIDRIIAGANAITDFPYVYGGGHASFVDDAYDCSGSVSYALAAGGLLAAPETSGQLESWGVPGPGRYLTIYANAGHVYMFVDGLRYDTAGRTGVYSTRWQTGPDPVGGPTNASFVARHWPGL